LANEITITFDDTNMLEDILRRRHTYQELKSCIEALIALFLLTLLEKAIEDGDGENSDELAKLYDYIRGEMMYLQNKCLESEAELRRALKSVQNSLANFEKNYEKLEKSVNNILRRKNSMVVSLKISSTLFSLINDVSNTLGIKKGLKSAVLNNVFEALQSDDPESTVKESAARYWERVNR